MKRTLHQLRSFDKSSSEILDRLGLLLIRVAGFVLLVEVTYRELVGR